MSIIIKGVDMPKNEELWIRVQPDGNIVSQTGYVIEDASAKQVSQHGRLIDESDVMKSAEELRKSPWYNDLIKSLRICSQSDVNCGECEIYKQNKKCGAGRFLMEEAADAIEALQAAKCPHYIRNVHDRGDDSLCRKWVCEVKDIRKRGKWTLNKDGSAICSRCGRIQFNAWDMDNTDNFCHFCGADMRELPKEKT